MCGICGIFLFDNSAKVDPVLLRKMNETLVHRGPDDEGYHVSRQVGLAMRRLSIIDLEHGHQPISNEDGSIWIVYNGEIYNHVELHETLAASGHTFRTRSDTEVIVHLYEELAEDCVNYLNGMFAFAIWDSRRNRVFLARDRLGIKPLFYSYEPGKRILFASEIKALFPAGIGREPDYQALYDYLSLMYVPTPATAYRSVRKLPPGSSLTCSGRGITVRQYWDIPLPAWGEEEQASEHDEEELRALLEASVRRHMIADVDVGAFLSGGLDSTMVTAIMAKKLQVPVQTFTIGFDRKSYDESPDARLVAQTLGTKHREEIVSPGMVESIPDLLSRFDEPFADYSAIPTYLVSRIAAQWVKVVLTGDGGDEFFVGYPTHVADKVVRIFRLIPRVVRQSVINPAVMALPTSMKRISLDYKAKRFVTGVDLPFERGHYHWKVIFDEQDKKDLCTPDFLNMGHQETFRVFDQYFRVAQQAHPLNRLLYVDAKTFLLDDNLTKVDRMTMANSLEARVPLLDHELIERVAILDPHLKSRGLQTKRLLRRVAEGLLPKAIRKGKKRGFTPPLPHWIGNELKGFVSDVFSPTRLSSVGLLNPEYCRQLLNEHLQGRRDCNREIWTIVALVNWLEKNKAGN